LQIKNGAPVILLKNLKFGRRALYNGMRGQVNEHTEDECTVLFNDGQLVTLKKEMFSGMSTIGILIIFKVMFKFQLVLHTYIYIYIYYLNNDNILFRKRSYTFLF